MVLAVTRYSSPVFLPDTRLSSPVVLPAVRLSFLVVLKDTASIPDAARGQSPPQVAATGHVHQPHGAG